MKLDFTQKEIKLIVEALAFSSCCDVCSEWDAEDENKMIELAEILMKYADSNDYDIVIDKIYHNPPYEEPDKIEKLNKILL